MKDKSAKTKIRAPEKMLNIGLPPDVKRGLERVSLYNSRTQRKQAAIYVAYGVQRDLKRIWK